MINMRTPEEKIKRSNRLKNRKRSTKKARRYVDGLWSHTTEINEETKHLMAKKYSETRTPCSCHMCGNPRKHFNELTKQEILADISTEEEIEELDEYIPIKHGKHKNIDTYHN